MANFILYLHVLQEKASTSIIWILQIHNGIHRHDSRYLHFEDVLLPDETRLGAVFSVALNAVRAEVM